MADHIRFNVYVTIKEGRHEDFKGIARDWSAFMKKERPDVLSYEWFFMDDDPTKAQVMEVYESSEAMLATMEQNSETGETDYPYEMVKLEVCGNVSDALRKRLDAGDSPIQYWSHVNGFTR